jgi:hypothetical protein
MTGCPWYISAQAVRDYIAIRRMRDPDGERTFEVAERELMEIAGRSAHKAPKRMDSGALQYRGPKPHKLNLIVREEPRPEGPKPQLVRVIQPGGRR